MFYPSDNAPDLVVIEPVIETIDLGVDSDNETEGADEGDTEEKSGDFCSASPATEVKIKEEPVDIDIEEHQLEPQKKSKYDEVLESTLMENYIIDNVDEADELATEENEITQAIESTLRNQHTALPQITNVSGNVDDTCAIGNIDESAFDGQNENISLRIEDNSACGNVDDVSVFGHVEETCALGKVDDTSVRGNVDDITVHGNDEEASVSGRIDDTSVCGNVVDTSEHGNADNTNAHSEDNKNSVTDMVTRVADVEFNEDISNSATCLIESFEGTLVVDDDISEGDDLDEDATPDSDTSRSNNILDKVKDEVVLSVDSMDKAPPSDERSHASFSFGDLSVDFTVGDGIEFVDDGIAYVDEDNLDGKCLV